MAEVITLLHHGVTAFYQSHSAGTDAIVTAVGTTLAVRTTIDGITYLTRPIVASVGNCYYGSKRWIKDRLVAPDRCLKGLAYLCCLEGLVAKKLHERRRTEPSPSLDSRAPEVGKPVWSDEAGCYVLYQHANAVPLKLRPESITGDVITYSVIHAHTVTKSTACDEKRVKKLESATGWTIEDMRATFHANVIIVVDDKPYGIGWRTHTNRFTTAFHMGPLKGRKVELVGAGDYLLHGKDADRAPIDLSKTEIQALAYEGCRSKTGFDAMMVTVSAMVFARIGVSMHKTGLYKGTQGTLVALGFDMSTIGDWKKLVVHTGNMKTMPGFTALSGTFLHTVNTEAGWSGTPLYKLESPGAAAQVAGMHICAVPGSAAFNAAVSAPQLEQLIRSPENEFAVVYNCPFQNIVIEVQDDDDEGVVFMPYINGDEKSTAKKMGTDLKRR